jgi:hypothetical protein
MRPPLISLLFTLTAAIAVLACAPVADSGATVQAQAPVPPAQQGGSGPPFAVSGFRYQLAPNNVHMFLCDDVPRCGPDARVSYMIVAAQPNYRIEQFRDEQQQVAAAFRQRLPAGSTVTVEDATDDGGRPRVIKGARRMTTPDGRTTHILSTLILGEKVALSLISSSGDRAKADANRALFMVGSMLFVSMQK